MPNPAPFEFMRFSAPDPEALARRIEQSRADLAAARAAGDDATVLDLVADLGGLLTTARQEHAALTLLQGHEALAQSLPLEEPIAWFWTALATAEQYVGERQLADGHFALAVALADRRGWRRIEAMALHHWGRSLVEQGRLDDADERFARALRLREALNHQVESSHAALAALAQLRTERSGT
ncbi:hypothetical protein [Inhella crocodyli]|uniref:Uncharacterized protein n=1 Tax=Inhella crocodyli TaxID=2499851 RepID=A0A437LC10_9BURK|nr:hypothetical protein [Inhella crocodyli]RVT82934.1 hypothetical protein EOD73_15315 [Inhella crocodyli]